MTFAPTYPDRDMQAPWANTNPTAPRSTPYTSRFGRGNQPPALGVTPQIPQASNIYKQDNYDQPTYRTPANPDPNKMYAQGTTNQPGLYAPRQPAQHQAGGPEDRQILPHDWRNTPYQPGTTQALDERYGRNNNGNPPPYRPPAATPVNPYQTPGFADAYNARQNTTPGTGGGGNYGFTPPPADSMNSMALVTWRNSRTGETFTANSGGWQPPSGDWTTTRPTTPAPTPNVGTRPITPAPYIPPGSIGYDPSRPYIPPAQNQPAPITPTPITPAPITPGNNYPQPSYVTPVPGSAFGTNFTGGIPEIGAAADRERQESARRNAERSNSIISGYDQQIGNSQRMSDADYQQSQNDYAGITADANATRARNMGRIDQYGQAARSDLNIKNKQALAAASQSAISRGLGNTTIRDSLQRGQNFDNSRQMMNLEDQLLQNRISTDSNLSNSYQNTLQTRAQFLQNQRAQKMANERDLRGRQLQFIEGINDEGPSFNDVSNYYMQAAALRG